MTQKMELWWPWLEQFGPASGASTAIATWWLVVATFVAAVATALGVWMAFHAQTRERQIERQSDARRRYEETVEAIAFVGGVIEELEAAARWLRNPETVVRADIEVAAFRYLALLRARQMVFEALLARDRLAIRWALLVARAHRATMMAARMLGERGRHQRTTGVDPELPALEHEVEVVRQSAEHGQAELAAHPVPAPAGWIATIQQAA